MAPLIETIKEIESWDLVRAPSVDWEKQWEAHSPFYHQGLIKIHLKSLSFLKKRNRQNVTINLTPGPGFGDLSHPTTCLCIELMQDQVKGQVVVDIGAGSGILSFFAKALGAEWVWGIDIEKEAIVHAMENAELNGMEKKVHFGLLEDLPEYILNEPRVYLMNMITSQQTVAWESLRKKGEPRGVVIVSGILESQREEYEALINTWGFKKVKEVVEGEWLGAVLNCIESRIH